MRFEYEPESAVPREWDIMWGEGTIKVVPKADYQAAIDFGKLRSEYCTAYEREIEKLMAEIAELKALDRWNNSAAVNNLKEERDELARALEQAYADATMFLNEGDFKRHVVWDAGYIVDLLAKVRK